MDKLLNIKRILYEPTVLNYQRGQEILARFSEAERVQVSSHWNIPELHGNQELVNDWVRVKRDILVLGVRKSLPVRVNGRSADFIAPGAANGCAMACVYCYVPRRKGYANPITTFVNIEDIMAALRRHAAKQSVKPPSQTDPKFWVYDIGENSDSSVDALLSDNVHDLVNLFKTLPNAKASFATKYVNYDLLNYDPQEKTRIRFSLMPAHIAKTVDVRTSPMAERIAAINPFVEAGYEVHINLSPVILYEGWLEDYRELFQHLDETLTPRSKDQLKAEIIFLTHNEALHNLNMGWHPKAEELLWKPELQEGKTSIMGGDNVRYKHGFKGQQVNALKDILAKEMTYCEVRYAF
jgi:spore photoproduct lyase